MDLRKIPGTHVLSSVPIGAGKGKGGSSSPKGGEARKPQELEAGGSSANWEKAKDNHEKVGNQFCEYIADNDAELGEAWGRAWLEVPESEVASTRFFGFLADFISAVRTISDGGKNAGELFSAKSAETVFNGLLQSQKKRFICSEGPAKVHPPRADCCALLPRARRVVARAAF